MKKNRFLLPPEKTRFAFDAVSAPPDQPHGRGEQLLGGQRHAEQTVVERIAAKHQSGKMFRRNELSAQLHDRFAHRFLRKFSGQHDNLRIHHGRERRQRIDNLTDQAVAVRQPQRLLSPADAEGKKRDFSGESGEAPGQPPVDDDPAARLTAGRG